MEVHCRTYSGKNINFCEPLRPEQICIYDIAHHLSLQCRYNGATSRPYSVAEHCLHMLTAYELQMAYEGLEVDPETALCLLLHDAAEAYIGDVTYHLKKTLMHFQALDNRITAQLFDILLGKQPHEEANNLKCEYDRRICINEMYELMGWIDPMLYENQNIALKGPLQGFSIRDTDHNYQNIKEAFVAKYKEYNRQYKRDQKEKR